MAEIAVFNMAGNLKWGRRIWSVIYSFPTGLILNKFRIHGMFGGENLASCLAGWNTPTIVPWLRRDIQHRMTIGK